MKIKNTVISIVVIQTLICNNSAQAQNESIINNDVSSQIEVEPKVVVAATWGWIASAIMSAASSAIKSGLKSALQDAIFGSNSPNFVTLSEESLLEIENLIQAGFDSAATEEMINSLQSLELSMKSYSDSLENSGVRNVSLLANMETQSNSLYTHPAFNTNKSYYSDLTLQYSAAASLRYAVLADKVHFGENSIGFLESQGAQMAASVTAMGAATDSKITSNITVYSSQTSNCTVSRSASSNETLEITPRALCWDYVVTDKFANTTYLYRYRDYGNSNWKLANETVLSLKNDYSSKIKGEQFQNVVNTLNKSYN